MKPSDEVAEHICTEIDKSVGGKPFLCLVQDDKGMEVYSNIKEMSREAIIKILNAIKAAAE